jgi:hypothetical protein
MTAQAAPFWFNDGVNLQRARRSESTMAEPAQGSETSEAAVKGDSRNNPIQTTTISLTRMMVSEELTERHGQDERRKWDPMDKRRHESRKDTCLEKAALPAEGVRFAAGSRMFFPTSDIRIWEHTASVNILLDNPNEICSVSDVR